MSLVLLDIDGTLIGPTGRVDDAVWAAASRARGAGVRLAVCTGRTHAGVALEIAERLDADAPHIFHNGALVTTATGHILSSTPVRDQALRALIDHARRLDATLELYTTGEIYVDRITPECAHHAEVLEIEVFERDLDVVLEDEEVIRGHWILTDTPADEALAVDLPDCNASTATSPALPDYSFISVTHVDASKGSAAAFAADHLGVDLADVVGVGDSDSDVPMLERVGHPFAMGDSDPELLERFPNLDGVDAHGVIEALEFARRRLED